MTQKTNQNPWTLDVRVRERNLRSGSLTEKDVEKFLAALPDVAGDAEPFGVGQPALVDTQHHHAPPAHAHQAYAAESASDAEEDEDEDDDNADVAGDASEGEGSP